MERWSIPNGGYGRAIVVDPKYRNEADMRRLAQQLHHDTIQDRNASIFIYDDKIAASRRLAALDERLGKKELADHDKHAIGAYQRNINTGYHGLTITLEGLMGPAKEIPQ